MSDSEKDRPENPRSGDSEAKPGGGAIVISIEQARAELLAKPRQRATPQLGVSRSRHRAREVPAPVTLPPGEHAAVIVTDTPAARAHVDKKTVHPGEMPSQTHDKKVRVKTSLDPRRAKTQISDRRGPDGPSDAGQGDGNVASLWQPQPASVPPPSPSPSVPPRSSVPSPARPAPIPRSSPGMPLFLVGVILAAGLGAGVVYLLGRNGNPPAAPTATAALPTPSTPPVGTAQVASTNTPGSTAVGQATGAAASAEPPASATATSEPPTTAAAPPVTASAPVVKTGSPPVKATAATSAPTATAKPTATNVLPFGKEEP